MSEKIAKLMNDSPLARWTVLVLVALMMFFAYMFVDVMSPLKSLVESDLGWNSSVFGKYAASEYILNVCGFLILAGVILDKLGVRFSGILSAGLMVAGAAIKFVGISDWFQTTGFAQWLGSWWVEMPASAKMASLGFMIFGCGCEMEGTNVSKILAKWFKGKEMALAMGLEMAIARLGVFAVMWIAPIISNAAGGSILAPLGFCGALLCIGLINFIIFGVMDRKFDSQLVAAGMATEEKSPEDEFHISDLGAIFKSKMFWIVALLCVLYYSAIFPFQRYAPNFLEETLGVDAATAARLFSCFPFLAMCLTPLLVIFLDRVGKGATMLMLGSIIMIACHLSFAFVLPLFPHKW
ncbi:MAG: MFS transporter, partial [Oscillospiraceae bacterium]|nr:MFS transporter [Oscillospiraceae bacterium]